MSTDLVAKPAATHADRVNQVLTWIVAGASEHEIQQAAAATWPGVKCAPLIVTAMDSISSRAHPDPETVLGWGIEATRVVYQQSIEARDFSAALRAIKQLVDLSRKGK